MSTTKDVYSLSKGERDSHEGKYGNYNDFPPGWAKLTEAEAAKSKFFQCTPWLAESRQMYVRNAQGIPHGPMTAATLYHFSDGTGIAASADYWAGKVSWFKFGLCEHDYLSQGDGHCQHKLTCKKCGHTYYTDSSD